QAARALPRGRRACRGREGAAHGVRIPRDDGGVRELVVPRREPEPEPAARGPGRRPRAPCGTPRPDLRHRDRAPQRARAAGSDRAGADGAGGGGVRVSLLVVGSVALDTVETPFGRVTDVIGGSAVYFSASASVFHPVQLVGVVGSDYPIEQLDFLARRGVDLAGLERAEGESFRWSGFYDFDLNNAQTRGRRLGVGAEFRPHIPEPFRDAEWVFLASTDPDLQSEVLDQVRSPRLVACDTMDHWIESKRDALLRLLGRVDVLLINEAEIRRLSNEYNLVSAARWTQARGPEYVVVKKGEHGAMLFTSELVFFTPGYPLESIFDPTG